MIYSSEDKNEIRDFASTQDLLKANFTELVLLCGFQLITSVVTVRHIKEQFTRTHNPFTSQCPLHMQTQKPPPPPPTHTLTHTNTLTHHDTWHCPDAVEMTAPSEPPTPQRRWKSRPSWQSEYLQSLWCHLCLHMLYHHPENHSQKTFDSKPFHTIVQSS